jgi:hypothetical protein
MKAKHYIFFASCAVVAALAGVAGATSEASERKVNVLFMSDTHAALEAHPEVFLIVPTSRRLGLPEGMRFLPAQLRRREKPGLRCW